tara:strand:- start:2393 stop:2827 length:435 start_codon:yes stop_codon:yes gene_type:complete
MNKETTILWLLVVASFVGVIDSAYIGLTSLSDTLIPCGLTLGCDEVLSSPYSHLGNVSISWIGLLFYLSIASNSIFGLSGFRKAFKITLVASALAFLITLYLLYIQIFVLQAFCDYCLLSAFLVILILGFQLKLHFWEKAELSS